MTQDEIIEMAQECNLIGMRPHLDGIYSESLVAFANLVAAKERETLAQTQEPVGRFAKFTDGIWRPVTDYSAGVPLYTAPPQRTEERNFCSRCGKRTKDLTHIHTCTPPQD